MKKLIVILGPTGVGKTEISIEVARRLKSPIISSDSRQIYKEIPIGTDAPSLAQQQRVKHFFVGTHSIKDYYSASIFENEVISLLEELHQLHNEVVMSGGSMMYIDAVCKGIDDLPTIDKELRKQLMEQYKKEGIDTIKMQLKLRDPVFYDLVDLKNHKRVIHALEVCIMTGKPYSLFRTNSVKQRPFEIVRIGLTRPREALYARINARVDEMVERGLVEEARKLYPFRHLNALNTVGYKELFAYFDGECTFEFAIDKIKQHSRNYARKQLSWFNRSDDIHWIDLSNEQKEPLKTIFGIIDKSSS